MPANDGHVGEKSMQDERILRVESWTAVLRAPAERGAALANRLRTTAAMATTRTCVIACV